MDSSELQSPIRRAENTLEDQQAKILPQKFPPIENSLVKQDETELDKAFEVTRTGHKLGFDPYKKGSVQLAKKHRDANKIKVLNTAQPETEKCQCCGMPVDAPQFPLCTNVNQLGELGPGFPMYYLNVKYVFSLLFIGFLIVGLPCTIDNFEKDNDDQWDRQQNLLITASVGGQGNNDHIIPFWHSVLHITFMFILLVSYHIWRRYLIKKEEEIDMSVVTPSDYTVMVSGLPKIATEQEVKNFFEINGRADGAKATVVKVNFAYKIQGYIEDIRKIQDWKQKLKLIQDFQKDHPNQLPKQKFLFCFKREITPPQKIARKIVRLNERIKKFQQETQVGVGRDLLSGIAFVTFKTQAESRLVQMRFGKDFIRWSWDVISNALCPRLGSNKRQQFFYNGNTIHANIAPQPSDIYWENLGTSLKNKILNILKTDSAIAVALCASFLMVYGCSFWQDQMYDEFENTPEQDRSATDKWTVRINSIIPAFFVVIINFVLGRMIRYLSAFEKHQTITNFNSSVAMKLILSQFLNTAVIALIVNYDWEESWFFPGGLVVDMSFIFISMAFVQPVVYLVSPSFLVKGYRMKRATRDEYINQGDINNVFEAPPVDISQRYASLMKTVLVTFFYAPIIPGAFLISAIGVCVQFWVQKYVLLRKHSRPSRLSGDLAMTVITLIPFAVLLYAVMLDFFMQILNPDQSQLSFIWMILVICYICIPIEMVFGWFKKTDIDAFETQYADKPYETVATDFFDDYDRENPVTQNQGWKAYFDLLNQTEQSGNEQTLVLQKLFLQQAGTSSLKSNLKNYANTRQGLGQFGQKESKFNFVQGLVTNKIEGENSQVDPMNQLKGLLFKDKVQNPLNSYGKVRFTGKFAGIGEAFTGLVKMKTSKVSPIGENHEPVEKKNPFVSLFKQ